MGMKSKILPLGIKNRTKTELPALIALEAIGKPWFCEDHRCDLMSIALIAQLLAVDNSEIFDASSELMSLLGLEELDVDKFRPRVVLINTWIQKQPNGRIQHAIDRLLGNSIGVEPEKASKRA